MKKNFINWIKMKKLYIALKNDNRICKKIFHFLVMHNFNETKTKDIISVLIHKKL